jgi:hypothetical protein
MGPQVDVIYRGPDAVNEQQAYVCHSKRNTSSFLSTKAYPQGKESGEG